MSTTTTDQPPGSDTGAPQPRRPFCSHERAVIGSPRNYAH
jgi:hypothetical protein